MTDQAHPIRGGRSWLRLGLGHCRGHGGSPGVPPGVGVPCRPASSGAAPPPGPGWSADRCRLRDTASDPQSVSPVVHTSHLIVTPSWLAPLAEQHSSPCIAWLNSAVPFPPHLLMNFSHCRDKLGLTTKALVDHHKQRCQSNSCRHAVY